MWKARGDNNNKSLLNVLNLKIYLGQSIQECSKYSFLKAVFHKFYLVHS